jgi:hypothetical protein
MTCSNSLIVTELESDLLAVADDKMDRSFRDWKRALEAYSERGSIEFRRIAKGDDDAFDFLRDESIRVEVLGPILSPAGQPMGLMFLGRPRPGPRVGHESLDLGGESFKGYSASHTINGHSIILRLTYGQWHFLFSGDLNDQSGRLLVRAHQQDELSLQSEVLKVGHHGSANFSAAFIQAVAPIVSVISSGDETSRKEYIHPRATTLGALGLHSRIDEPLIFVTEMVAFFETMGWATVAHSGQGETPAEPFFAFKRTTYGIVKFRTDGERMFVYTNSGRMDVKEAYAYCMDKQGQPVPDKVAVA